MRGVAFGRRMPSGRDLTSTGLTRQKGSPHLLVSYQQHQKKEGVQ
jgi:hypothetical protein